MVEASQSKPGQVAAAIKAASVAQHVPVPLVTPAHGHEAEPGQAGETVAKLLGMTAPRVKSGDATETAADPS